MLTKNLTKMKFQNLSAFILKSSTLGDHLAGPFLPDQFTDHLHSYLVQHKLSLYEDLLLKCVTFFHFRSGVFK